MGKDRTTVGSLELWLLSWVELKLEIQLAYNFGDENLGTRETTQSILVSRQIRAGTRDLSSMQSCAGYMAFEAVLLTRPFF